MDFLEVRWLAVAFPGLVILEHAKLGQALHLLVGKRSKVDADFHALKECRCDILRHG